jgi:IS30 family transposase
MLQMKKYNRITLNEREKIYNLMRVGHNHTIIAKKLNRHKSSISRELKRCSVSQLGYLPDRANDLA